MDFCNHILKKLVNTELRLRTNSGFKFRWPHSTKIWQQFRADKCQRFLWPIHQRKERNGNNRTIALEQIEAVDFFDPFIKEMKTTKPSLLEQTVATDFCDLFIKKKREVTTIVAKHYTFVTSFNISLLLVATIERELILFYNSNSMFLSLFRRFRLVCW